MILAEKVAVVADVAGVSDVLNLKTQQLSDAAVEPGTPPMPLRAVTAKRSKIHLPVRAAV